jgi:excisionase family DNA binding protein
MSAPQLLTVLEAAKRLGCSDDTIRNLVHAGRLACVRVGVGTKRARMHFTEADLAAYVERHRTAVLDDDARPTRRALTDMPEAGRYA